MQEAGFEGRIRIERATGTGPYQAALRLLTGAERPTAISACHDEPALGVQRAVADAGLTADEVAVAGYDGIELAGHPGVSLTTVIGTASGWAASPSSCCSNASRDGPNRGHEVVTPDLVVRSSTRPPRPRGTATRLQALGEY